MASVQQQAGRLGIYLQTPSQTPGQPTARNLRQRASQPPAGLADPGQIVLSLKESLDRMFQVSRELHDYIQEEGIHRSYFVLAPTANFVQLAEAVESAYFLFGQSIVSLPIASTPSIKREVLTRNTRRAIEKVLMTQRDTCRMIVSGVRIDERVQRAFGSILRLCEEVSASLRQAPDQPDQLVSTT